MFFSYLMSCQNNTAFRSPAFKYVFNERVSHILYYRLHMIRLEIWPNYSVPLFTNWNSFKLQSALCIRIKVPWPQNTDLTYNLEEHIMAIIFINRNPLSSLRQS